MSGTAPGLACKDSSVLVPSKGVDMHKWAVIACDQFTAQPEYWEEVNRIVGTAPSSLHITYPEIFLNESEDAKVARIENIQKTMQKYLDSGVLSETKWPVYVERTVLGNVHRGVVVAVDLEKYEFERNATSLIRPTEETIVDRLPPRMRIRRGAPLETPHIILLIDDPKKTAIEYLSSLAHSGDLSPLYATELMQGGGKVEGYTVNEAQRKVFFEALTALAEPSLQCAKYGESAAKSPLLYAVGDGNHSLATAKSIWEEKKKTMSADEIETSPSRYALVELCNLHGETLVFEPIHRVIEGEGVSNVLQDLQQRFGQRYSFEEMSAEDAVRRVLRHGNATPHVAGFISPDVTGVISISDTEEKTLSVATLQPAIDDIVRSRGLLIDYVHGEDVTVKIGKKHGNCGIVLPPMQKSELFPTVVKVGLVPRKTFSMGHAVEKRYYVECRKIM